jgi:dipeptidyl aminopeptidase/acylaminoacyl peptidase
LETLELTDLVDIGTSSAVVDDVKDGLVILRVSSPVDTPRFAVLDAGKLRYLTNSTHFSDVTYEIILNDNCNDAIVILAPGDKKKFVVSPHGGPCSMFATYFSRYYTFFLLNGYSLCLVNFRGSTGAPVEVQKMLPGRCCEIDVEDVVWHIDRLRATFDVEKLGIWGWSYGGLMATVLAGRCSDKIDFAVAGAPVVNMISSYYTSDISDWPLVTAGVKIEPDGEIDEDIEVFEKLWRASPIRFVKSVNVPVLLIHAKDDRRVPMGQSYEFFYAMKRAGKPVKLLLYENGGHSLETPDAWTMQCCPQWLSSRTRKASLRMIMLSLKSPRSRESE